MPTDETTASSVGALSGRGADQKEKRAPRPM